MPRNAPESHAEPSADSAPPRTWTIALPAGTALLNANQRLHWSVKARKVAVIRSAACLLARQQRIPRIDQARILVTYRPASARRTDAGNWSPSAKACLDGLTDAGVWLDDDSEHVLSETYVIGDKVPGGQLVLTITEVTGP